MLETLRVNIKDEIFHNGDYRIYKGEYKTELGFIDEISIQCNGFKLNGGGIKLLKGKKVKYKGKDSFQCISEEINLNDKETLINLLSQVDGISEIRAMKILNVVSDIKIFEDANNWSKIPKIEGIGDKTRLKIFDGIRHQLKEIKKNDILSQLKILLHKKLAIQKIISLSNILCGKFETKEISDKFLQIEKIVGICEEKEISLFKAHPYPFLIDLLSCSFKQTDSIALEVLNIDENNKERLIYLTQHLLKKTVEDSGSTYTTEENFKNELESKNYDYDSLIKDNPKIIIEDNKIFPESLYNSEKSIASLLKRFSDKSEEISYSSEENIKKSIKEFELKNSISLNKNQRIAVKEANDNNICCIIGGAGTGKTTLLKVVIESLKELGNDFTLVAPTGIASLRMKESTGLEASTIHSFVYQNMFMALGYKITEVKHTFNKVLIVDESSMIDVELCHALLSVSYKMGYSRVIFVGDDGQLSSVGSGNFLNDLIESNTIKIIKLTKTMRQKGVSDIVPYANTIREMDQRIKFDTQSKSLYCKTCKDPIDYTKSIFRFYDYILSKDEYQKPIEKKSNIFGDEISYNENFERFYNDCQIIIPTKKGDNGVEEINRKIKSKYNPECFEGYDFNVNDKVMCIKNDKKNSVMNGDSGIITSISKNEFKVKFKAYEQEKTFLKSQSKDFMLAYAVTVHKIQGAEYKFIIIVLESLSPIVDSCLLYTAITRGKGSVIICSNERNIKIATNRKNLKQRNTMLKERLIKEFTENEDKKDA